MNIRRYSSADRDAVWALHKVAMEAVAAYFPGAGDADFDDIEGVYLGSGGEFLVGELDGTIVARGALRPIDSTKAELKRMRVLPEHQRMGFGQAMLDALERRARELGFAVLELDTTMQQVAARRLYEKNGYEQIGTSEWTHATSVLYRKRLSVRNRE